MEYFPSIGDGQNLVVFGITGAVVLLALVGLAFAVVKWRSPHPSETASRATVDATLAQPPESPATAQAAPPTSKTDVAVLVSGAYLRSTTTLSETRYPIQAAGLRMGTAGDNDLVINDDFAGRVTVALHHARIEVADGQYILVAEKDAAKELRVDGRLSRENLLRDGARIQLGEVVFEFCRNDRHGAPQAQGGLA